MAGGGSMKLVEKIAWKLPTFIFHLLVPHYLIIGAGTGEPIGCTNGEFGKEGVLYEEPPETTFIKIKRSKCQVCKGEKI
jgi:hypothetical protein